MPAQKTVEVFQDFVPVAGYNGVVFVIKEEIFLPVYAGSWSLNFTTDTLSTDRTNRFGRYVSLYFIKDSTPGMTSVTASVAGWYNDTFLGAPYSPAGLYIQPGIAIEAFFGHTSKSGYFVKGYISSVSPSVSAAGTNSYAWTLQITEIQRFQAPTQPIQQPNMDTTVPNIPVPRLN